MADFETKLRWLSERGKPVGAEELIERIEAELAGDPLVVVAKRREGRPMTKTQQPPVTRPRNRYRGPATAVAAFLGILAVAALFLIFSDEERPVADAPASPTTVPVTTPTTASANTETMTDLEIIEAGVAAIYSGDADRAVELFDLPDRPDDQLRGEAAYQAAVGGRLTLRCIEREAPGEFRCTTPYHNVITDAIGHADSPGDSTDVVVEDGRITSFAFPEHSFIAVGIGSFLITEGRLDGYEDCAFGPFTESCATIQLENLDAWMEWRETVEPATLVEAALESWYGGDCVSARFLGDADGRPCSGADVAGQTIEYESILGADVSLQGCEVTDAGSDYTDLSCEVRYSNAMNAAVNQPPSVTTRDFSVLAVAVVRDPEGDGPWYEGVYPEDRELLDSFRQFAEAGVLQDEYAEARCASARTPECASLIVDNLDDWAAWYQSNG